MTSDYGWTVPAGPSGRYLVLGAHRVCREDQCHYSEGMAILRQAQKVMGESSSNRAPENRKETMPQPAQALICESGETEHPFSSSKGYVLVHKSVYDGSGIQEAVEYVTLCRKHGNGESKSEEAEAIESGQILEES